MRKDSNIEQVTFCPKTIVEGGLLDVPARSALISIRCPGEQMFDRHYKWVGKLELFFHDIDRHGETCPAGHPDGLTLFSNEHARSTLDFLDSLRVDLLAIHCSAGLSRSPAVAMFVRDYYHAELMRPMREAELYNRHVYNTLKKEFERRRK